MRYAVAAFMALMGAAMAAVWTRDILGSPEVDRSRGVLRARERGTGVLFLPHWLAEYATAGALIAGAAGLVRDRPHGHRLALAGLGALVYTSVNSLGWALARRERRPYAVPMLVGALGGLASIAGLLRAAPSPRAPRRTC